MDFEDFLMYVIIGIIMMIFMTTLFYLVGSFIAFDFNINHWTLFKNVENKWQLLRLILIFEIFIILAIFLGTTEKN